jgi:plasmid stabilization system protein ParE
VAQIVWTDESLYWLEEIHDYIARDRPEAAIGVVQGIFEKAQLLRQNPHMGFRYEPIEDREVRILLFGQYRIVYLIRAADRIDILGIYHAAMDIERLLR